jgi:hypothetical protein
MLKKVISISLLAALICSGFSRFFIYAGFELNHKYIAENLCVNKSRPWMHCNGKCYFMRKIKEAQENEKKQQRTDQKNSYQDGLPALATMSVTLFTEESDSKITYPRMITPATIRRSGSILQPPKVA